MVSEVWIPLKMANSAHLIHGVRAILPPKKLTSTSVRACVYTFTQMEGGSVVRLLICTNQASPRKPSPHPASL